MQNWLPGLNGRASLLLPLVKRLRTIQVHYQKNYPPFMTAKGFKRATDRAIPVLTMISTT